MIPRQLKAIQDAKDAQARHIEAFKIRTAARDAMREWALSQTGENKPAPENPYPPSTPEAHEWELGAQEGLESA